MRLSHLILAGAAGVLVSLPAPAQDKEKPPSASPSTGASGAAAAGGSSAARGSVPLQQNQTRQQLFDKLDANQSGSVSRAESQASPPLLVIFIEMDTNSDGELSSAEFARVPLVNPDGTPAR
jgi:hypothetical protein